MFFVVIALMGFIMSSGTYAMNQAQAYPPFAAGIARKAYSEHPDILPQTAELIAQLFKGVISESQFYTQMKQAGYSETIAHNLYEGARNFLSGYDYVSLWRRGHISEEELKEKLGNIGYSESSQQDIKNATLYYPNPNDLVRMAVREVFTPEVAQKYGQFEDLPEEFLEASDKAGLSREFATNYWASHWELPSAFQGFEMFQRDIITKDELLLLLKSLDYMPYWRDKMVDLQYNVIGRVDVRRLYKTGVYDKEQVVTAYEHMGYSPKDAQDLADFTFKEYAPVDEDKQNLTGMTTDVNGNLSPNRSMIMDGYNKGLFDRGYTFKLLMNLGYSDDSANYIIDLADATLKQQVIDIQADSLTDAFRAGVMDETEYRQYLTELGVTSRYIEIVVARELAQAKRRSKEPSKTDLGRWVKKGLIEPEQYLSRMVGMGYSPDDALLFYEEINPSVEEE